MTSSLLVAPPEDRHFSLVETISCSPVFAGLGPGALRAFIEAGELRSYEALQEAVVEGSIPDALSVVLSGRFIALLPGERLARYGDGAMVSLDCYVPGDSFGEQSLKDGGAPALASVVATEPAGVLAIEKESFHRITSDDSRIGRVVYRNLFQVQTSRLASLAS